MRSEAEMCKFAESRKLDVHIVEDFRERRIDSECWMADGREQQRMSDKTSLIGRHL